jgi:hypothetical protein
VNLTEMMRRDCNERARRDAFLHIASWKRNWNEETFFASGESGYQLLVEPVLLRLAVTPAASTMAELGCGAGRMTRAFARRFHSARSCARLAGIDPQMIGRTWRGIALSSGEVDKMVRDAGGLPVGFQGADSPLAWCRGRKIPQEKA